MAEIEEGSLVRYTGTGTVGTVKVLKEEDGQKWALLDSTSLYYDVSTLEVIERAPERRELEGFTREEIERRMKMQEEVLSTAQMQDGSLESGG